MADATSVVNKSEGAETAQETPPAKVRSRFKYKSVLRPRQLRIICIVLVLVSFIILLTAITTNNWMGDGQMSVGLWYACLRPLCAKTPDYIHPRAAALKVVHIMLFVAVFFATGATLLLSVSFFQTRFKSTSLAMLSGIASIAAGIFIMIGMSVYTHGSKKEKAAVHSEWSFYTGWVASSLFLLTGLVTLMICRREHPQERQEPQEPQE